ncbi:MAG: hypothetical protein KBC15_03850 [Candidatus Levybacteria bacterium]|nr:hypothetical protein [Candidatus Levybacteria bacterium]
MVEFEKRDQSPPSIEAVRQSINLAISQQEAAAQAREADAPGGVVIRDIYFSDEHSDPVIGTSPQDESILGYFQDEHTSSERGALENMERKFADNLAEYDIRSGRSPKTLDEAVARDRVLEVKPELANLGSRTLSQREFVG